MAKLRLFFLVTQHYGRGWIVSTGSLKKHFIKQFTH